MRIQKSILFSVYIVLVILFFLFFINFPEKNVCLCIFGVIFFLAAMIFTFLSFYLLIRYEAKIKEVQAEYDFRLKLEDKQDNRHEKELLRKTVADEYDKVNAILKTMIELYKSDPDKKNGFTEEDKSRLKEHLKAPVELIQEIKKMLK